MPSGYPSPPLSPRDTAFAPAPPAGRVIGQWIVGETLGKGSFSTVRRAVHAASGRRAVCKTTDLSAHSGAAREKQKLYVLRELAVLAVADHPNVVKLYDAVFDDAAVHVFEEAVDGVELFDYLGQHGRGGRLPEDEARVVAVQCLRALQHLHARGVVHRDVKLDNIMVVAPRTPGNPLPFPLVKLIDFNLSALVASASEMRETVGCVHYSSSWVCNAAILAERYGTTVGTILPNGSPSRLPGMSADIAQANDVWALCVSVFGMLQGYFPFRSTSIQSLEAEIRNTCGPVRPLGTRLTYPAAISHAARGFIEAGLDPAHPMTAEAMLRHEWLAPLDKVAAAYPLLNRRALAPLEASAVPVPADAVDDEWYAVGLLLSASTSSRRATRSSAAVESMKRIQACLLRRTAEALAAFMTAVVERSRARNAEACFAAAAYPSPAAAPADIAPWGCAPVAGYPVFRSVSNDSGYGSAGSGDLDVRHAALRA
ncbi:kinase-like domain-containing protein [Hyaloraphidium curvatum]|nr:kinase-like domain-containing protein [Hyaloraphidium curvatum]